jgi:1-acyl-sn-glycerol-3-phosphate acyltransferase
VSGTERVVVVAETNETDPSARAALRDRVMALATIHLNGPADEVLLVPARTVLKTSSGKIRRAACRELYEKGLLQAPRRAVWLQLGALIGQAVAARLRRGARSLAQFAYGAYCWLVFLVLSAVGVVALCLLSGAQARRLARGAARVLVRGCAIPLAVDGLEPLSSRLSTGKPAVIAANHASYVDAMILTAVLPPQVRFAAKREFERVPLIGFVLRRLGAYFVERVDPARGIEDTRELMGALRRGETIAFFPEGTFSRAPGLAEFRLGAFAVSAETGTPVVPIALRGTRSVLRDKRWLPVRSPVEVRIEPAMQSEGSDWSAAVRLRDRVREVMLRECGEPDLTR